MLIYEGDFQSQDDIINSFDIDPLDLYGCEILFATYDNGGLDGEAFVLFKENNILYEVNGAHCSCYGLEQQWSPEETSIEALEKRRIFTDNQDFRNVIENLKKETTL